MSETFGQLLQSLRAPQMSRRELSSRVRISVSLLSLLENGKRNPKRHLINEIADALKVPFERRNSLLVAAGYESVKSPPNIKEDLYNALTALEFTDDRESELLVRELKAYAVRWKHHRDARRKHVQKAVILAAGWQSRVLAVDKLETHDPARSPRSPRGRHSEGDRRHCPHKKQFPNSKGSALRTSTFRS